VKETYDKSVDYIAGETVVGGEYRCVNCGETLRIADRKVTNLPVCPNCQSQHWAPGG
jgi:Zn finger protein HypA/HybF involved in hydrogenase expression